MKRIILKLILLLFVFSNISASGIREWYNKLDSAIFMRQSYLLLKENRIDSLRQFVTEKRTLEEIYQLNRLIYEEYIAYQYDSAMSYIQKNREIAYKINTQQFRDEVTIDLSKLLSTAGLVNESMETIKYLDRAVLDSSLLLSYYEAMEGMYYSAKNYSNDTIFTPMYECRERLYIDSILMLPSSDSLHSNYYKAYRLLYDGELEEAKLLMIRLRNTLSENTRFYAIVSSNLATISYKQGNGKMYEQYLIEAAIADIKCSLKENTALQRLANLLYLSERSEDIKRAYNYISYSMEDALFYKSRLRVIQVAEGMPNILEAYYKKTTGEKRNMEISLIVISILFLLILLLMAYIDKQLIVLKNSRRQLRVLNLKLNELNYKLQESNKIREEAVGLFVNLSFSYIAKMEQFQETIKRKILAKQINDLYNLVTNTNTIQSSLTSFYENFDKAFLRLYPSFISDFNALLVPEERIELKEGELLNTDLRIFALIKMGVSDSSKIAAFLHYSPQTIYNYRNKIKNKAIVDRESFEKYIHEIS